ncbi:hypothetical protein NHX12_032745 [Muraenolepis orangiensis]|uniref:Uncharacterized protein n=1 Tax=Muraenolepis orangiensis TaxID=630683 RepID=A0A9Q0IIZ0_9TELE|nr:hypothetical protein NHX12_032745 [Muraenolepis orangiensis]
MPPSPRTTSNRDLFRTFTTECEEKAKKEKIVDEDETFACNTSTPSLLMCSVYECPLCSVIHGLLVE